MTQTERVLKYIEDYGSISSLEAFKDLGVTRLSAAIYNLRAEGYPIVSHNESALNRYGEKTHYARYTLSPKTDGAL